MKTRPHLARFLGTAAYALAVPAAFAQSFSFPSFPNANGLALNGSANVTGNGLVLTPAQNTQRGSAFYDQAVNVGGGFRTTFSFFVSNDGADGFAFIVQNDPRGTLALGDDGTSLGYSSYTIPGGTAMVNSIAIEFDLWDSGAQAGDTSANEVSIHTDGVNDNRFEEAFSLGNATPNVNMSDGAVHTVQIDYAPGTLTVFVDDLLNPVLSVPYSFATGGTHLGGTAVGGLNLIGGTSAFVGFTGTTGGVNEVHEIRSWQFGPLSLGVPYCSAANNSTGGPGALAADGTSATAANNVTLRVSGLPNNAFGFFLTSRTQGFVMNPGGSSGNLCLGGAIGRYVGPGQIKNSGATGGFQLALNLTTTPTPTGIVQIVPGESWNFQAWHRDSASGSATSNFTNGLQIVFH
ncbi:MAG: L-type lectin-domain containing protein [Planctomycetota bacterium]